MAMSSSTGSGGSSAEPDVILVDVVNPSSGSMRVRGVGTPGPLEEPMVKTTFTRSAMFMGPRAGPNSDWIPGPLLSRHPPPLIAESVCG
jgi:hypothetical protein